MISVITSIYKGHQYLKKLFPMLEPNTLALLQQYPGEQVEFIRLHTTPLQPIVLP